MNRYGILYDLENKQMYPQSLLLYHYLCDMYTIKMDPPRKENLGMLYIIYYYLFLGDCPNNQK